MQEVRKESKLWQVEPLTTYVYTQLTRVAQGPLPNLSLFAENSPSTGIGLLWAWTLASFTIRSVRYRGAIGFMWINWHFSGTWTSVSTPTTDWTECKLPPTLSACDVPSSLRGLSTHPYPAEIKWMDLTFGEHFHASRLPTSVPCKCLDFTSYSTSLVTLKTFKCT